MKLYSKMAWRNLWKSKRRTFTTGMAILAGYAGLCLLGGYILRVEKYLAVDSVYINHAGHISIYKKDALGSYFRSPKKFILNGELLEKIKTIVVGNPEVDFTSPVLEGMGLISNGEKSVPFLGLGIDPSDERKIQEHPQVIKWTKELLPKEGELSLKDATGELSDTISITKELGTLIGRKPPFSALGESQKQVVLAGRTLLGDLNAVNANLGFKHSTGLAMMEDTGLIGPLQAFRNLYDTDGATYLSVYLKDRYAISSVLPRLKEQFDKENLGVEAVPFSDDRVSLFYVGTMGFLYIMAGFFVFLIFSAVALSIVNSMTINLFERLKEIGTIRAMGFNKSQAALLLTIESFYLSTMSLILGLFVAQISAYMVNSLNIRFNPPGISGDMQFVLTPDVWFCVSLALPILLICVVCTHLVSKNIIKKPIVGLLQQSS